MKPTIAKLSFIVRVVRVVRVAVVAVAVFTVRAPAAEAAAKVMLVFGDADMVRPEHEIRFYQLLGGGLKDAGWNRESMPRNRLAILPDLTHYEIFASPRLAETVLPFLNGQSGAKTWADQVKAQAANARAK